MLLNDPSRFARWLARHPDYSLALLAAGFVGPAMTLIVIGVIVIGFDGSPPGWLWVSVPATRIILCIGGLGSNARERAIEGATRQERIRKLTRSLEDAMTAISDVRAEVERGTRTLEELERRVDVQRELANLPDAQAQAVLEALREQFHVESRRSLRHEIMVNSTFFVLGFVLALVTGIG